MGFEMPECGFVFWPVGCGDSTTIIVGGDHVVQVDIHHVEKAEEADDPRGAVVDHLVDDLPSRDGRPYLAVFALTHLDQDHCKGFTELLERAHIGEMWFTPRIFQELEDDVDMCPDAAAFCKEARRRMDLATSGKTIYSGDRIRVIGSSELLAEGDFADIPGEYKTVPGKSVSVLDGEDVSSVFRAFIHAPFKADADGDRNGTSIGVQVTLHPGSTQTTALLLGDLDHAPIERIFEISDTEDLAWNILLAPHHCSKSVMYVKENGEENLDQGILDAMDAVGASSRWVISSSPPVPASNEPGDNPPHAQAKLRYQELVDDSRFLCTGEHGGTASPTPIVFEVTEAGVSHSAASMASTEKSSVADAIARGRGGDAPHGTTVGFGKR